MVEMIGLPINVTYLLTALKKRGNVKQETKFRVLILSKS